MSNYYRRTSSLAGMDISGMSDADLRAIVADIMGRGLHGLGFSPYMDGQDNKTFAPADQIRERMSVLAPSIDWVRTFSCTRGNEAAPLIASDLGLKSMVGVWIDDDFEYNELELAKGIEIANQGHAGILAIGNEVMLRQEMSEDQLIDYINRAKAAVPDDVPVGYVDAYFLFENHPRVAEACDIILVNCYPFWEGYSIDHAHVYMKEMFRRAQRVANGKKVVVAETGWPNRGTLEGQAMPNWKNAAKYFIDAATWAEEEGVDLFYFAGFDEEWKVAKEGGVGAFWGLWDKDGKPKYW